MRATEFIAEEINPDILHPEFKHKQVIGDYTYTAKWNRDRELRIRCYDGRKLVGQVDFYVWGVGKPGGKDGFLASGGTEVKPEYRRKGIAYTMYAYAKMLGNDIRSGALSPDGRAMWDAWTKSGEAKHLTNEEINPDILHPEFKDEQVIGDYTYTAASSMGSDNDNYLVIKAYHGPTNDPLNWVAQVSFFIRGTPESGYLESLNTWVAREYREKGIARTMYSYAKMLGNTVKPSSTQTDMGKKMWSGWKQSGDAEHLLR